jgi:hypothetical protein
VYETGFKSTIDPIQVQPSLRPNHLESASTPPHTAARCKSGFTGSRNPAALYARRAT